MSQSLIHVSDLTKQATTTYRAHFMDYLRVLAWLLIPATLASLLPIIPMSAGNRWVLNLIFSILIAVMSLWLSVVLVDLSRVYLGKSSAPKKILQASWGMAGRIVDFVLISLLQGIVVIVGLLLFVIPGLIFAVWFSFSRYSVIVDGVSPGSAALRASKTLVAGRFWPILWRWVGSYLYFGSFFVLGTVAILAAIGALLGNAQLGFVVTPAPLWWSDLIVTVISTLFTPLFILIGVILYEDAKRTR